VRGETLLENGADSLVACSKFFDEFKAVFVAIHNTEVRDAVAEIINESISKTVVLKVTDAAWCGCKTVQQFFEKFGADNLTNLYNGMQEVPNAKLLNYADITPAPRKQSVISGIKEFDRNTGGFRKSELNVWTGTRGSGKTTLVNHLMLDVLEQREKVCIYSGELTPAHLRSWHLLQAAGRHNVHQQQYPESGKFYYSVLPDKIPLINAWWNERMYCFDTRRIGVHAEERIFSLMEFAANRNGCSVFVLDNLMTVQLNETRDFYRAQTRFITGLVDFARRKNVIVHLVAHPRKTARGEEPRADDVAGIADITNLADNVYRVSRLDDDDESGANSKLTTLKNREYGKLGDVLLHFDEASRRFSDSSYGGFKRRYSWEDDEDLPEGWGV